MHAMDTLPYSHDMYVFARPPTDISGKIAAADWDETLLRAAKARRVSAERHHFTLLRLGRYPQHPTWLIPKFEQLCEQLATLSPSNVTLDWLGPLGLGTCVLGGGRTGVAGLRRISRAGLHEARGTGLETVVGATAMPHLTLAYL